MKDSLMKNLGVLLVLAGVLLIAVYYLGVQVNALLVIAIVLELAGIISFIFLNKKEDKRE